MKKAHDEKHRRITRTLDLIGGLKEQAKDLQADKWWEYLDTIELSLSGDM